MLIMCNHYFQIVIIISFRGRITSNKVDISRYKVSKGEREREELFLMDINRFMNLTSEEKWKLSNVTGQ